MLVQWTELSSTGLHRFHMVSTFAYWSIKLDDVDIDAHRLFVCVPPMMMMDLDGSDDQVFNFERECVSVFKHKIQLQSLGFVRCSCRVSQFRLKC